MRFLRHEAQIGKLGRRDLAKEINTCFAVETKTKFETREWTWTFTKEDVSGRPPAKCIEAFRFLNQLNPGNTVAMGLEYGRLSKRLIEVPEHFAPLAADIELRLLEDLLAIQEHTTDQIVIPPLADLTSGDVSDFRIAASLLKGEVVPTRRTEIRLSADPKRVIEGPAAISIVMDWSIKVGEVQVDVGKVLLHTPRCHVHLDAESTDGPIVLRPLNGDTAINGTLRRVAEDDVAEWSS